MNNDILLPSVARTWPDKIITDWRRFSSGLWRVPEGDIQAAYSAESFPRVKVFNQNSGLFTNSGGFFTGPVAAAADCYPLIPVNDYRGPKPQRYTYEGREAFFRADGFKLGPKVVFVATDARVEDWRQLFRVMYADGGWFARHTSYGLFLSEGRHESKCVNAREALRLEFAGDLLGHSKSEMQQFLDGDQSSVLTAHQLDLTIWQF
jgi:hypothetical protein